MKPLGITLPIWSYLLQIGLSNHEIKCVGIDTLSVEKYGYKEGLSHKKLLSNGIGIIENLNSNLKNY